MINLGFNLIKVIFLFSSCLDWPSYILLDCLSTIHSCSSSYYMISLRLGNSCFVILRYWKYYFGIWPPCDVLLGPWLQSDFVQLLYTAFWISWYIFFPKNRIFQDICHCWLRFEREYGTLEDFDHATQKVHVPAAVLIYLF